MKKNKVLLRTRLGYVTLAGEPHHPKCLATSIPVKMSYEEHFGMDFKSFGSRADLGHFLGTSHIGPMTTPSTRYPADFRFHDL